MYIRPTGTYWMVWVIFSSVFSACVNKTNFIQEKRGIVMYITANRLYFFPYEIKNAASYLEEIKTIAKLKGFSFEPTDSLKKIVASIKADTIIDESSYLRDYSPFVRENLIFPAAISYIAGDPVDEPDKFMNIISEQKALRFDFYDSNLRVTRIERINP
jgi:hypothetical protein